jgi:HlyD family secretion protein
MKRQIWALSAVSCLLAGTTGWLLARAPAQPLVTVTSGPLAQSLVFSGRVAARVRVELGAAVTGRVAQVLVREGDVAQAGQLLVQLETDELRAQLDQAGALVQSARARADSQRELALPTSLATLAQADANLAVARQEAQRTQALFARGFVAQARVDETERALRVAQAQVQAAQTGARVNAGTGNEALQARLRVVEAETAAALAQTRLQQTRIRAPSAGRVVARSVDPGQVVQPGKVLLQFAADGPTQLIGQADEKFLALLAPGQLATVLADAFPEQPFQASISSIAPSVDPQRGTIEVKFSVVSPPAFLREDMTLSLQLQTGRREQALTLPASAVLGAGAEGRVRRIVDGRVSEQTVRVGLRTLERVEIVEGLTAGESVLAQPLSVQPGARVRAGEPR